MPDYTEAIEQAETTPEPYDPVSAAQLAPNDQHQPHFEVLVREATETKRVAFMAERQRQRDAGLRRIADSPQGIPPFYIPPVDPPMSDAEKPFSKERVKSYKAATSKEPGWPFPQKKLPTSLPTKVNVKLKAPPADAARANNAIRKQVVELIQHCVRTTGYTHRSTKAMGEAFQIDVLYRVWAKFPGDMVAYEQWAAWATMPKDEAIELWKTAWADDVDTRPTPSFSQMRNWCVEIVNANPHAKAALRSVLSSNFGLERLSELRPPMYRDFEDKLRAVAVELLGEDAAAKVFLTKP
jgi:hypothetical protein